MQEQVDVEKAELDENKNGSSTNASDRSIPPVPSETEPTQEKKRNEGKCKRDKEGKGKAPKVFHQSM